MLVIGLSSLLRRAGRCCAGYNDCQTAFASRKGISFGHERSCGFGAADADLGIDRPGPRSSIGVVGVSGAATTRRDIRMGGQVLSGWVWPIATAAR
jgi:hypothetical protein